MAPPQISKNFKFKPIFPISSHGVGPSTSTESLPSGSTNDDRGKKVVCDSAPNDIKKKKRKMYEGTCKLQDAWTTEAPWEKLMLDEKGQVNQVCCMVYIFVEVKEKLLTTKLDSLLKH